MLWQDAKRPSLHFQANPRNEGEKLGGSEEEDGAFCLGQAECPGLGNWHFSPNLEFISKGLQERGCF
jgi:hypothetical protein